MKLEINYLHKVIFGFIFYYRSQENNIYTVNGIIIITMADIQEIRTILSIKYLLIATKVYDSNNDINKLEDINNGNDINDINNANYNPNNTKNDNNNTNDDYDKNNNNKRNYNTTGIFTTFTTVLLQKTPLLLLLLIIIVNTSYTLIKKATVTK